MKSYGLALCLGVLALMVSLGPVVGTDMVDERREDTWMLSDGSDGSDEESAASPAAEVDASPAPPSYEAEGDSPREEDRDTPSEVTSDGLDDNPSGDPEPDWGRLAMLAAPSVSDVATVMANLGTLKPRSPVYSLTPLEETSTDGGEPFVSKHKKGNLFRDMLFFRRDKERKVHDGGSCRDSKCWTQFGLGSDELRGLPKLWDGFLSCAESLKVPTFLGLRPKHSVASLKGLASIVDLGIKHQKLEYGALHEMSDILEQYYRRKGGERGVEMHCALPVMEQIAGRAFLNLVVRAENSSQRIQLIRFSEQRRHVLHNAIIGYLEYLDIHGLAPLRERPSDEEDSALSDLPLEDFQPSEETKSMRRSSLSYSSRSSTSSFYSSGGETETGDMPELDNDWSSPHETEELSDLSLAEGYEKILKRIYLKKVSLIFRDGKEVQELSEFLDRNVLLGRVLNIQNTDIHTFKVRSVLGFNISAVELLPAFYGLFMVGAHQWIDIEKLLRGIGPVRSGPFVPGVHEGDQPLLEIFRADGHNRVTFFRFNEHIEDGKRPESAKQYTFSVKGTGLDLGTPVAFDTTNVGEAAASLKKHMDNEFQPLPFRLTSGLVGYDQCEGSDGETFACRFDGSCDSSCSTLDFHNQREKHKLAETMAERMSAFKSIANSLIDPYCALVLPKLRIYTLRLDETVRDAGFAMPSQLWQGAHGETSLRYRNMRGAYSNTNKYTWVKPHYSMRHFGMKDGDMPVFGGLDVNKDIVVPEEWKTWAEKTFIRLKAKDLVVFPLTVTTSPTAVSIDLTKSGQRFFCGPNLPPCFTVLACGRSRKDKKCAIVRMNLRLEMEAELDIPSSLRKSKSMNDMPETTRKPLLDTPVFGPSTSLMMMTHALINTCFVEAKSLFLHDPIQAVPSIMQYIGKNKRKIWKCVMEIADGDDSLQRTSSLLAPLTPDRLVFAAEAVRETKEEWYQVMNSVGGHLFRSTASRYNGELNEFSHLPVPSPDSFYKEILIAWTQLYNLLGSYLVFVEDRDSTSVQNGPSFADRNMGVGVRDADSWGTGYFHGERIASVMNGEAPDGKVTYAARDLVDVYQSLSSIFQNIYEDELGDYRGTSLETLVMDVDIIKGAFGSILNQLFGISHLSLETDGTSINAPKGAVYLGMYQWNLPMKTLPNSYPSKSFGKNIERRLTGRWKPKCSEEDDGSVFCLSHMEFCLKPDPVSYLKAWESWSENHRSPPPPYLEYGAETEFGNIIAAAMKCLLGDDVIAAFDGTIRDGRASRLTARTGLAELFYGISLDVPARNEGRLTIPKEF